MLTHVNTWNMDLDSLWNLTESQINAFYVEIIDPLQRPGLNIYLSGREDLLSIQRQGW